MRTCVYIDGFNLYYGAVKDTPYRWLDIGRMCRFLLPNHEILRYRYFTAIVSARPHDPQKPVRQQSYLRALRTIPDLEITLGHFLTHEVSLPLAEPSESGPRHVRVLRTEEKGSDVNLAVHLVNDAYLDRYDVGVVISNDSDLVESIRIVTEQMHKRIGILNPQKHPSRVLHRHAAFFKQIREGVLRVSQFPDVLHDQHGLIQKPQGW